MKKIIVEVINPRSMVKGDFALVGSVKKTDYPAEPLNMKPCRLCVYDTETGITTPLEVVDKE